MINLGSININKIIAGSTDIVKVMGGTTLLWELITVVTDILQHYKDRIAADGGTYIIEGEDNIIDESQLLLLTPNGYDTGKLYSVLPTNGSGDFTYADAGKVPLISNNQITVQGLTYENLYPYGTTLEDMYYTATVMSTDAIAPFGGGQAWKLSNTDSGGYMYWYNSPANEMTTGKFIRFITTNSSIQLLQYSDTVTNHGNCPKTSVYLGDSGGRSWYRVTYEITAPSILRMRVFDLTNGFITKLQIATSVAKLDAGYELTSGTKSYASNGDVITANVPSGVDRIYYELDGVRTKITTIPSTYQLPLGKIDRVEMFGGPDKARFSFPSEGEDVDVTNPITITLDIL